MSYQGLRATRVTTLATRCHSQRPRGATSLVSLPLTQLLPLRAGVSSSTSVTRATYASRMHTNSKVPAGAQTVCLRAINDQVSLGQIGFVTLSKPILSAA